MSVLSGRKSNDHRMFECPIFFQFWCFFYGFVTFDHKFQLQPTFSNGPKTSCLFKNSRVPPNFSHVECSSYGVGPESVGLQRVPLQTTLFRVCNKLDSKLLSLGQKFKCCLFNRFAHSSGLCTWPSIKNLPSWDKKSLTNTPKIY